MKENKAVTTNCLGKIKHIAFARKDVFEFETASFDNIIEFMFFNKRKLALLKESRNFTKFYCYHQCGYV